MLCIRRVIIEPRYRGLGLASKLVAETMPMTGAMMVEAISVMGKIHPFFERAGMQASGIPHEAKTERMVAALEAAGIGKHLWHDGDAVHKAINQMDRQSCGFVIQEMERFCQKFTNRRRMPHSSERTCFVLSKLAVRGEVYEAYYIQPLYSHNFFAKIGTQYYDYEYSGSGNPLGAPVKISEITSLDALNPVVDKVWNYYASVTFRY